MPFKGTLDTLSMTDVLQLVAMTRKSGCLVVDHPSGEAKRLYFDGGEIVTASSNATKDRLGEVLVRLGLLSREQVEASRRAERRTGVKQGQVLVDNGFLTDEQLDTALGRQIAQICCSVMVWREGTFDFVDDEEPAADIHRVREPVMNLIMEGTRQLDEWSAIHKVFPTLDLVMSMSAPKQGMGDIRLQPDEWQILTLIDGKRSIQQICAQSSFSNFEVCKKLLNLHHAGLVTALAPPSHESPVIEVTRVSTPPSLPHESHPPPPRPPQKSKQLVPPGFHQVVRTELTKHVGPIAPILLDEIVERLGVALDQLPVSRVEDLLTLLCNEIDSPAKQEHLREVVLQATGL